jgi:branched-chain amino acid aminotransferase
VGRVVYLNGEFLPEEQARVSVLDRGFLYGDGLFETIRSYSGRPFRLTQHFGRLSASAGQIGISLPFSEADLAGTISGLLERNGLGDAYVRVAVSRGEGLGVDPPASAAPTVSVLARKLKLPEETLYRDGASVIVLGAWGGQPLAGLKSLSYLDRLLARRAAREAGADDAVLANAAGHLAEASSSNVFLVSAGALRTPSIECGLLPGVTRQAVLEIAESIALPAVEGRFSAHDLAGSHECFLTNSIAEILPVTRAGGAPIGSGQVGPVTAKLAAAYKRLVASELDLKPGGSGAYSASCVEPGEGRQR